MAQGFDGIHSGGAHGGIEAEDVADEGGNGKGEGEGEGEEPEGGDGFHSVGPLNEPED